MYGIWNSRFNRFEFVNMDEMTYTADMDTVYALKRDLYKDDRFVFVRVSEV